MEKPLADRLRPQKLEDVVGQQHLLGEGKVLYNIIKSGKISNMIFYGPSGTGKTTVANIVAKHADKPLYKLNATNASVADIKKVLSETDTLIGEKGVILYLDEIQNFNKKQQQSLLECIENGKITLIASTTENPYFYIYNAILSRSTVFEFKEIKSDDIKKAITRAVNILNDTYQVSIEENALEHLAACSNGDARKALNTLEMAISATNPNQNGIIVICLETIEMIMMKKAFRHDRDGDSHYDVLSAFQKSIRGSDPDASLHYMSRLIQAGDMASICRRLLVIAAEDIGLAYPNAIAITKACVDSALMIGLPEARLPLAQAVVLLATAPKSNSIICAIDAAIGDIENGMAGEIPPDIKDAHYKGASNLGRGNNYKYPHNYKNNYVKQQYLPDTIADRKYYNPGNNKFEQQINQYWSNIKEK